MRDLTTAAAALLAANPKLSTSEAWRMALRADLQAFAAWHAGSHDPPSAAHERTDPAVALMAHMAAAGCSFAQACNDLPRMAAAWHEGELVRAPGELVRFKAPSAANVIAGKLTAVPIFRTGK